MYLLPRTVNVVKLYVTEVSPALLYAVTLSWYSAAGHKSFTVYLLSVPFVWLDAMIHGPFVPVRYSITKYMMPQPPSPHESKRTVALVEFTLMGSFDFTGT